MKKYSRDELIKTYFSGLDIEFDDTLSNFQKYALTCSMSISQINDFNSVLSAHKEINLKATYTKTLYQEMASTIFKNFRKSFTEVDKCIDLTNERLILNEELNYFIKSIYEDNLIISSGIYNLLVDLSNFSHYSSRNIFTPTPHKIGVLDYKNISVDPHQQYEDTMVLSYDKILINLHIEEPTEVVDPHSFRMNTILSFKMDFKVINSKIHYIITDETSEEVKLKANPHIIRLNRDKVINLLLND